MSQKPEYKCKECGEWYVPTHYHRKDWICPTCWRKRFKYD